MSGTFIATCFLVDCLNEEIRLQNKNWHELGTRVAFLDLEFLLVVITTTPLFAGMLRCHIQELQSRTSRGYRVEEGWATA